MPWEPIELLKTLFATGAAGSGWAVLGLCAASAMRWYTFRQMRAERNQQIHEMDRALDLQLKSFEVFMKQREMRRLNGHGGDGAV